MGRRHRSRLDLLYPDVTDRVEGKQWEQKRIHDKKQATRTFARGDSVFAEDFSTALEKWIPGTIEKVTSPVSYQIRLENGKTVRRHVDNI